MANEDMTTGKKKGGGLGGFLKGATLVGVFGTVAICTAGAVMDPSIIGFADTFAQSAGNSMSALGTAIGWGGEQLANLGNFITPDAAPALQTFT